jgi:hypothetical protein
MSAPTFPMAAAAEQAAAALAAAEQRGAKAAVAHLRSVIAEAVAELPVWPEGAYQTPMERDVSAVRAALVAALAEARPAGEVADGCRPEDGL